MKYFKTFMSILGDTFWVIVLLVIFPSFVSAQQINPQGTAFESLNYYPDRAFRSEFEQKNFEKGVTKNEWDLQAVFLGRDAYVTDEIYLETKTKLETFYQELEANGISSKSQKKQISLITKAATGQFFKTVNHNYSFDSLVQYGHYNCVTAIALMGITFDKFQIAWTLEENATGFEMIPQGGKPIELPEDGNMCSPMTATLQASGTKHSLQTWAAVYYAMDGMTKTARRDRIAAIAQFEKAFALDPSDRYRNEIKRLMEKQLQVSRHQVVDDIRILAKQYVMAPVGKRQSALTSTFESLGKTFLHGQKNEVHYDSIYYTLVTNISDKNMREKLATMYYYERGNAALKKQVFEDAVPFLTRAVAIRPDFPGAQESLFRAMDVVTKLNRDPGYGDRLLARVVDTAQAGEWKKRVAAIYLSQWSEIMLTQRDRDRAMVLSQRAYESDPGLEMAKAILAKNLALTLMKEENYEALDQKIKRMEEAYPFLGTHPEFQSVYASETLLIAIEYFKKGKLQSGGLDALDRFGAMMKTNPNLAVSQKRIENAYWEGSTALIKTLKYDEAEALLKTGREYVDTSKKLTEGLQAIVKLKTDFKKY